MIDFFRMAYSNSLLNKITVCLLNAYANSRLAALTLTLSRCYSESAIGKAFARFAAKKPTYQYSFYQETLDKISVAVSVLTQKLNRFFAGVIAASALCGVYLDFVKNKGANKLRAVAIFGFYFFLAAAALSVFGFIGAGRAAISFCLSLAFLALSLAAGKLPSALKNSFFAKLLMELIK